MEHYGKSSLCPLKYYIGGSVFYESAFEIWKFCVCFFSPSAAITPSVSVSLSSTQQLCPVNAKMHRALF